MMKTEPMNITVIVYDREGGVFRKSFANDKYLKAKAFAYEESQWESCKVAEIRTESGKLLAEYKGWFA